MCQPQGVAGAFFARAFHCGLPGSGAAASDDPARGALRGRGIRSRWLPDCHAIRGREIKLVARLHVERGVPGIKVA